MMVHPCLLLAHYARLLSEVAIMLMSEIKAGVPSPMLASFTIGSFITLEYY